MSTQTTVSTTGERPRRVRALDIRTLVGSGDRIGKLTAPFLVVGLGLNMWRPALFSVGGPPMALKVASAILLVPGVTIWLWSVVLVLRNVPRGALITGGPFSIVKHPIYTAVSLLVLPWLGFLLDTWLGALVGIVMYVGSRRYAPEEEAELSRSFGAEWDAYRDAVKVPWL